ncbi:MAG: hypothetical protein KJ000_11210 [Pirellulaceae bacterium]|nr:hypothetical protein [Pirellulaceae bacterium]
MPRKPKTTDANPVEAAPASAPAGMTKTAAIRAALKAHPGKQPKEIAELLQADGWDVKAQRVSIVKSAMKAKKKARAAAAAPKAASAAPVAPADAISLDSLKKAKELASQLGGIDEAKAALAALAELVD